MPNSVALTLDTRMTRWSRGSCARNRQAIIMIRVDTRSIAPKVSMDDAISLSCVVRKGRLLRNSTEPLTVNAIPKAPATLTQCSVGWSAHLVAHSCSMQGLTSAQFLAEYGQEPRLEYSPDVRLQPKQSLDA